MKFKRNRCFLFVNIDVNRLICSSFANCRYALIHWSLDALVSLKILIFKHIYNFLDTLLSDNQEDMIFVLLDFRCRMKSLWNCPFITAFDNIMTIDN